MELIEDLLVEVLLAALLIEESIQVLNYDYTRLRLQELAQKGREFRSIYLGENSLVKKINSHILNLQVIHQSQHKRGLSRRRRTTEKKVLSGSPESQSEELVEPPHVVLSVVNQLLFNMLISPEFIEGYRVKLHQF